MRYRISIVTGDVDDKTFEDLLRRVLKALTKFPAIAVRFEQYHPDQNGAG